MIRGGQGRGAEELSALAVWTTIAAVIGAAALLVLL
jgi:hypothetical protein